MAVPDEPILFSKATSAICGPNDDVLIPGVSEKMDWELELGVVIGKHVSYASESQALDHVAAYCVINDLPERAFQLERGDQWVKGKSADTFGPIGPWRVTSDEVPDPQNLSMWLEVDGHRCQDCSTRTHDFQGCTSGVLNPAIYELTARRHYLNRHATGAGMGQNPPGYLRPGHTMRLGIEGLGEQQQKSRGALHSRCLGRDALVSIPKCCGKHQCPACGCLMAISGESWTSALGRAPLQ